MKEQKNGGNAVHQAMRALNDNFRDGDGCLTLEYQDNGKTNRGRPYRRGKAYKPEPMDTVERIEACLGCKVPPERCKGLCFAPGCKDVRPGSTRRPTGGKAAELR